MTKSRDENFRIQWHHLICYPDQAQKEIDEWSDRFRQNPLAHSWSHPTRILEAASRLEAQKWLSEQLSDDMPLTELDIEKVAARCEVMAQQSLERGFTNLEVMIYLSKLFYQTARSLRKGFWAAELAKIIAE